MDRSVARALGLLGLTAVVGLMGCQLKGSGYRYVRNNETRSYFKLPEEWVVEQPEETTGAEPEGGGAAATERSQWFVTFRAGPVESDLPSGAAQVLTLTAAAREGINFQRLNGLFYDGFDDGIEEGTVTVQLVDDVDHLEGFRGRRLVYTVRAETGRVTVDQTTLLDDDTSTLYAFMIRCTADCYADHRGVIDEVVASWTVKE